jgi:putative colanic acid biosynthesis acetyltransferase WcaB
MDNKKTRLFNYLRKRAKRKNMVYLPFKILYDLYSLYVLGIEMPTSTKVGKGFTLFHGGRGSVVNPYTIIGNDVVLRQNTTIGSKSFTDDTLAPIIEDRVEIGPNVCIIGKITIGHDSQIGAGAVVVKDVPAYSVVVGNPAHVIKQDTHKDMMVISEIEPKKY